MLAQIVLPLGEEASKRAGKNPTRDSEIYPIEGKKITSQTGEVGIVRRSPDMDSLKSALQVRLAIYSFCYHYYYYTYSYVYIFYRGRPISQGTT